MKSESYESGKALFLGVFIVAAIAIMIGLVVFLRPTVGDNCKELHVRFTNVDRVRIGTHVNFAGKPVGEVTAITLVPDFRKGRTDKYGNFYAYELTMKVDSSVDIYSYDDIAFSTAGLMGEKVVAIRPKATPEGHPKPEEITSQMLWATSDDKMNELMQNLNSLSTSFDTTLAKFNGFFDRNDERMTRSISAMSTLFENLNQENLPTRVAEAAQRATSLFTSLEPITLQLGSGRGTFSEFIFNDNLHCQITATLARLELLLQDINRYGLLFQYDKNWQRERRTRLCYPQE